MIGLQRSGWKIRTLFQGALSRPNADAVKAGADAVVVRLIGAPRRMPQTPIEQRLVVTLEKSGPVLFARLVKTVAADLYAEELRKGAGLLDIGLFGDRLFNGDIVRELRAGNGILWEMRELE
jgi:hypothetical protein